MLLDIAECGLRLSEALAVIDEYRHAHPQDEVYMDGELYAIMVREARA